MRVRLLSQLIFLKLYTEIIAWEKIYLSMYIWNEKLLSWFQRRNINKKI